MWAFEIKQRGIIVASGLSEDKADMIREGGHYAMIYGQDGPCELIIREATADEIETDD